MHLRICLSRCVGRVACTFPSSFFILPSRVSPHLFLLPPPGLYLSNLVKSLVHNPISPIYISISAFLFRYRRSPLSCLCRPCCQYRGPGWRPLTLTEVLKLEAL
jgi:hypothetical protein